MPTVINGNTGINKVQDGSISEADLAAGAVTDSKLSLAANSAPIMTALNASGTAPVYACRAWVNFDGTTTPPTIRASGNVSSVTKNGVGDYSVNFSWHDKLKHYNHGHFGASGGCFQIRST